MRVNTRRHADLARKKFQEENVHTSSSLEQRNVEESCLRMFEKFEAKAEDIDTLPVLNRKKTVNFLRRGLSELSEGYQCLDASRPWLVYWILHSLELLGESLTPQEKSECTSFLARCQNPEGGFGGGPGQVSHLAPTYAAVNSLAIIGTEEALAVVDRPSFASWLNKLRCSDGAFLMHVDGELDIRGVYCALSAARLTNVYSRDLFARTDQWLLRCQTYEGGFGGVPGMEAHGGYSFCGLAAMMLMKREKLLNIDNLLLWGVNRQMRLEGGFQGRTNKLVDGCYSFWQGGMFPLLHKVLYDGTDTKEKLPLNHWLFSQEGLQEYLLICCQDPRGGLVDKPGKSRDFYHTCYTLSGLSVAQHFAGGDLESKTVLGDSSNELEQTHPIYNICVSAALNASQYYDSLPVPGVPVIDSIHQS